MRLLAKPREARFGNERGALLTCPLIYEAKRDAFNEGLVRDATLSTGVPQIFPPEHNQVAGQAMACGKLPGPSFEKNVRNIERVQTIAGKRGARSAPLCC